MFHFPFDIPAATDPALFAADGADCPIRRSLALLAAGLDTRFLRVGTALAGAIETIDRMIGGLDGIVGALDANVAGAAVADLRTVADRLIALPAIQAARAARMATVADVVTALCGDVMRMHRTLRVLSIYGMNAGIAASGEPRLSGIADSLIARLGAGEELMFGFMARIRDMTAEVDGVQQAGRLLAVECDRVIPAAPRKLIDDAIALDAHLVATADLARRVATVARSIHGRIAAALGALQVGDSTRQRLEHVVSSLQLLEGSVIDGVVDPAVAAHVDRLLAAQLDATLRDFTRETTALVSSLAELDADTATLAGLIAEQVDGGNRAFLSGLEHGIRDVERVTTGLRRAEVRTREMAAVIAATAADLAGWLDGVRSIALDVQAIAADIRGLCRGEGTVGRAVTVIATEVDVHVLALDASTIGVARATAVLGGIDATLRQEAAGDGTGRDMGDALARALAVIHRACDGTGQVAAQGADDSRQFVRLVTGAIEDLRRELAVTDVMTAAIDALSHRRPHAPLTDTAEAALRRLLPAIGRFYTMAREREVHTGFLLPGMDIATPVVTVTEDDDDDGLF